MWEYKIQVQWEKQEIPYKRMVKLTSKELPEIIATTPENRDGFAGYWSPEHLFVAAASVCLSTTFLEIAHRSNLKIEKFRVESTAIADSIKIENISRTVITEIREKFYLQLTDSKFEKKARRVVEKSVENCIIANSVKSKVSTELILEYDN
ncbi:MAG: OsmC family protein [Promethearchaeota archaeon]